MTCSNNKQDSWQFNAKQKTWKGNCLTPNKKDGKVTV